MWLWWRTDDALLVRLEWEERKNTSEIAQESNLLLTAWGGPHCAIDLPH